MALKAPDRFSMATFGISMIGLVLLVMLTFGVSVTPVFLPQQRLLTGIMFTAICVLGIIAALYPSTCSGALRFDREKGSSQVKEVINVRSGMGFAGHHPACSEFSSHVFRIGDKVLCAGCIGLVAGATTSIAGSIPYLLLGFDVGGVAAPMFWVGLVGVACGLLPHSLLELRRASMRLSLNFLFVFGAFLLVVGVSDITGNAAIVLYILALIVYWIYARIMLSRQEHRRICANCRLSECPY